MAQRRYPQTSNFFTYPHAFFQSGRHLRVLYDNIIEKFCRSLQNYKYINVTPHLVASFGDASIGIADSGVDQLLQVRGRGRPSKEQQTSSIFQRPLSRPSKLLSSTKKKQPINHIHFIAKDMTDNQLYVFVQWSGTSPVVSWIPLST